MANVIVVVHRWQVRACVARQRLQSTHETDDPFCRCSRLRIVQVRLQELAGGHWRQHQALPWVDCIVCYHAIRMRPPQEKTIW